MSYFKYAGNLHWKLFVRFYLCFDGLANTIFPKKFQQTTPRLDITACDRPFS